MVPPDFLSQLDDTEYGLGFRCDALDTTIETYLPRIHETAASVLPPGSRYEIRASKQMQGGYYLEEEASESLSLFRQWLIRLVPLRWRRKWFYTYVPCWFGWCVVWYSLPKCFAQKEDWKDFVHTAIPPAESDFNPMCGYFIVGRCATPGGA